ncbi:MAG: FadR family transcriptional regulator [Spirochaetaceae bacterium]|nr:FadR family transcriptional regulator [Spirochaetaceae bacterium]
MKNKESKKIMVSRILESEIISGIWGISTLLPSEAKLCEKFSVSRITARAAIQNLVDKGFVKTTRGKGTEVISINPSTTLDFNSFNNSQPSNEDIIYVIELRKVFETGIAGIAAERITSPELEQLEKVYQHMINTARNTEEFSKTDFQFHVLIGNATKNPFIIKTYQSMQTYLSNTMEQIVSIMGSANGLKYHKRLLEALKDHNKKLAEKIMEGHIQDTIDSITLFFTEHTDDK